MYDKIRPEEVAVTWAGILINEHDVNPKWKKCNPGFECVPKEVVMLVIASTKSELTPVAVDYFIISGDKMRTSYWDNMFLS
ncbi:hypothetical protein TNCT_211051 [Trichonephila clavata]|uniref:Uncharacterized protein n=1 Tax=Trichonephila clavata TaxID=2740835 RepID=A0A8X6GY51_TRICU|nr:hypothetical protein TNCT_211051 [Trichonephila clavata]